MGAGCSSGKDASAQTAKAASHPAPPSAPAAPPAPAPAPASSAPAATASAAAPAPAAPASPAAAAPPAQDGTPKSFLFVKRLPDHLGGAASSLCLDVQNGSRPVQVVTFDGSRFDASSGEGGVHDMSHASRALAVLQELQHPNLATVFKVMQDPGTKKLSVVMEYASQGDLFSIIGEQGPVESNTAVRYFRDIISGLAALHEQRVAHRCVNPSCLVLGIDAEVKIIEGGHSIYFDAADKDGYVKVAGGPKEYWAPECFGGKEFNAYHADIWALGCTVYEVVTGKKLFDGTPESASAPLDLPADLDDQLKETLKECLSLDPSKRPQIEDLMSHGWTTNRGTAPMFHEAPRDLVAMRTGFAKKAEVVIDVADVESLFLYSELPRKTVEEGEYLTKQGDDADEAYFIESGEVITLMDVKGYESGTKKFAKRSRSERADLSVHCAGEVVGEVALMLDGATRTASLVAQTDIEVLVIHKDRIGEILDNDPEVRDHLKKIAEEKQVQRKKISDSLKRRLEMELSLGLDDLPELESELESKSFTKGEYLHHKGEKATHAWYISKGAVSIVLEEEGSGARVIGEAKEAEFVGEIAIILGRPFRLTSVVANGDVECFMLKSAELVRMMDSNPDAGDALRDAVQAKMAAREKVSQELKQWLELKLSLGLLEMPDIVPEMNMRRVRDGEILSKEGDAASECYYLKKGTVQLEVASGEEGGARMVGKVEAGGFVGEIAIIQGKEHRLVTSRAIDGDVEALVLRRSEMERMLESSAELKKQLQDAVANKAAEVTPASTAEEAAPAPAAPEEAAALGAEEAAAAEVVEPAAEPAAEEGVEGAPAAPAAEGEGAEAAPAAPAAEGEGAEAAPAVPAAEGEGAEAAPAAPAAEGEGAEAAPAAPAAEGGAEAAPAAPAGEGAEAAPAS